MSDSSKPATPSPQQLEYQRNRAFGIFLHFGINTFYGQEWSDGSLDPAGFAPTDLDAREWARTAKDAGAAHVILTAKHHDGFCLWPTATTGYSVASSPWKDGNGDVLHELSIACRDVGIGLGFYLSPWDRHEPTWTTDHPAYDALYQRQLDEILGNYGELVEVWFDGAGSGEHPYNWDAIIATVRRHQPDAMIFNMGAPTIRWVGNEDGLAADPCWYAVDDTDESRRADVRTGHRDGGWYLPPECDVPIRANWFWQPDDLHTLKSRTHLEAIWYRSIGLGATLLLNVPPDRRGRIDPHDKTRLLDFGTTIRDRFAHPVRGKIEQDGRSIAVSFAEPVTFDHLVLREDIAGGQHIGSHMVTDPVSGRVLVDGVFTIGSQRVHAFPEITTRQLVIDIDDPAAVLGDVEAHRTGLESVPDLEDRRTSSNPLPVQP